MSKEDFSKNYNKSRELCFDTNEFLKESFSVDTFLREHRNKASLEVMRDDLGTHLKALRLSMIELINKDYEDFVNLSKDLVGLDSGIQKIQIPLEQIKNDVLGVRNELEEAITGFNHCLEQHKEVTDKKRSLIHATQVITCIKKLKSILESSKSSQNSFTLSLIERATMEFNQLQFSVSKCEKDLLVSQKKEADEIKDKLLNILSEKFLECLKVKNSDELLKCLRIYSGLDKVQELESLVRREVVEPKLVKIVNEQTLQRESGGIDQVYGEVIQFIQSDLQLLLDLTTHTKTPAQVRGYDFMVRSIWPELEKRLNLPFMFAPGNPKLFHLRFTKSVELLNRLELFCGNHSSVMKLRQNQQYQSFLQRWNLPVYFKIRFQEIAGNFEKVLGEVSNDTVNHKSEDGVPYYLMSSTAVIEQIKKCWQNDVYLPELSHLFWKLSLQILSRYTCWLRDCLFKESQFVDKRKIELGTLQTSFGMDNVHVKSRLDFLVCLFTDTSKLLGETRRFLEASTDKVPNRALVEVELRTSLDESLTTMGAVVPDIEEAIVSCLVNESSVHFRQVSQIPRLFRRTNRKSSTEPCEYVGQVLGLPKRFRDWKTGSVPGDALGRWLGLAFDRLTNQYYGAVSDVLTNAQKTEESLRKLKKNRESQQSRNSGDEEIRQQLVIDVHNYSEGVQSFNVQVQDVAMLKKLVELVENARNKSEKQ